MKVTLAKAGAPAVMDRFKHSETTQHKLSSERSAIAVALKSCYSLIL